MSSKPIHWVNNQMSSKSKWLATARPFTGRPIIKWMIVSNQPTSNNLPRTFMTSSGTVAGEREKELRWRKRERRRGGGFGAGWRERNNNYTVSRNDRLLWFCRIIYKLVRTFGELLFLFNNINKYFQNICLH